MCIICLIKIMSIILTSFKFQLESHEINLGTCLTWHDTVFNIVGSGTEVSDQMNALFLTLSLAQSFHAPNQNHDSYPNVLFQRIHIK